MQTIQKLKVGGRYPGEESQTLEFKKSGFLLEDLDFLGKYVCGFANSDGGKLIIGVEDNGIICGVNYNKKTYQRKLLKMATLSPRLSDESFMSTIRITKIPLNRSPKYLIVLTIPKFSGISPLLVQTKDKGCVYYYKVFNTVYMRQCSKEVVSKQLYDDAICQLELMEQGLSTVEKLADAYIGNTLQQVQKAHSKPTHVLTLWDICIMSLFAICLFVSIGYLLNLF